MLFFRRCFVLFVCLFSVVVVHGGDADAVLSLVNKERSSRGLRPLILNESLTRLAVMKSNDMATRGYFSHYSRKLGSPFQLMDKYHVRYTTGAENIAMGQTSAADVFSAWMKSRGHRENILNPAFEEMGLARDSSGKNYWTQLFVGNPKGTVKGRRGVVSNVTTKLRGILN